MKKFQFFLVCVAVLLLPRDLISNELIIIPKELEVRVGLALSGGGARGISQIGVLKALESHNIQISAIAGTSIGAFVGGLYSVGYTPEEMEKIAISTNWENVLTILKEQERSELFLDQKLLQDRTFATLRFKKFKFVYPQALSLGWKFNSFIQKLIWNGAYYSNDFSDLKVPFRAVATDVANGRTVVISQGNLIRAMRASSAVPLLNTPIQIDTLILVDGGLFANIPVEALSDLKPDIVVAVNTTSPMVNREELNKPWSLASQIITNYMNRFVQSSLHLADFVITPEINDHPNDNFKSLDTLIKKGEEAANEIALRIEEKITSKKDSILEAKVQDVQSMFNFQKKIFLKQITNNDGKELFLLTEEITNLSLKDYLKKIIPNSIEKLRFYSSDETKIILEVSKHPTINNIKCLCTIPNLEQSADTTLKQFMFHYDSPLTRIRIIETLRKKFANQGFSFVKISIQPEQPSEELKITIIPNRIGKITVDPNIKTSDFIVRREVAIKEGDFTNAEKLVQSWNNLISSGLFSDVFIDFDLDTVNSLCNIFISAQERGTQVVNLLLRVDNERNLHGGADLIHENLFNTGSKFLVSLTGSKGDFLAKTSLSQTRIWKTTFSVSLEGFYYQKLIPIYKWTYPTRTKFESTIEKEIITERYNLNVSFGKQIERLGNLFLSVKFEKQRHFVKGELNKPKYNNINNFIVGLIYDSRDKSEFTSSGRLLNLIWEAPLFKAENNVSFSKATFIHSSNYPMFKVFVLRPRVFFGFADNTLPFPDFYSLGGDDNFVGLHEDELLGRQIFQASLDLQYRLPFKIYFDTYAILTYYLGSVWQNFDVIRISDLRHGLGITIGLDTPIGPVRLSAGNAFYFVKNPNSTVFGPLQLYFSIGSRLF